MPLNWEPGNDFNIGQWMGKHGPDRTKPICDAIIKAMGADHGVEKLGGVGYCLGAKFVLGYLADGKGLNAGYFAHPSATTADELRNIAGPLSIAAAGMLSFCGPLTRYCG